MERDDTDKGIQAERDLVIRNPQIGIEVVKHPFLVMAGFSPNLPDHLRRINDVLVSRRPPVSVIGFEMIPGQVPLVTTTVQHESEGYRVYLNAFPQTYQAELLIETRSHFPSLTLRLDDIQRFTGNVFPDLEARLRVFRDSSNDEQSTDFDEHLNTVTQEMTEVFVQQKVVEGNKDGRSYRRIVGREFNGDAEVRIGGLEHPFLSLKPWHLPTDTYRQMKTHFLLHRAYLKAQPPEVERVTEALIELLDKPAHYPLNEDR